MYLDFYGLKEKPFVLAPDPRFLYLTPIHREAFAQLAYGVREGAGFVLLTGDVGTGKTTLIHALRAQVNGTATIGFLSHSTLSFDGLLEYLVADLGIGRGATSRAQRLLALQGFLVARRQAGQAMLLILDEAHHLDTTTLEEVRLLSNFETPDGKLLQVLLVGQPELNAKLDARELRQLKQRIAVRASLRALTAPEVRQYIVMRLRVAGAREVGVFSEDAVRRIAAYTRGVPRLISIVCDHCLLFGYADQRRQIGRRTVEEVIRYLEGEGRRGRRRERASRRRRAWVPLGAVLVALVAAIGLLAATGEPMVQIGSVAASRLSEWAEAARALLPR